MKANMKNLQRLAGLYAGAMLVNLVMLAIILHFYSEPFSLLMDPFSWLGRMAALDGSPNTVSFILFFATIIFNILVWKKILALISESSIWRYPSVRILGYLVLTGFILMLFPCDRFDAIHSTGGVFVKGGLWAYSTLMLNRFRNEFNPRLYVILQLVLLGSVLFCGVSFLQDSPLKGFSQRPLLLAIIAINSICFKTGLKSRT
ncbi:MAG: hypothetical protein ACQESO_08275 [Bacillota bacterium]